MAWGWQEIHKWLQRFCLGCRGGVHRICSWASEWVRLGDAVLTEKAAVSNRPFSLLSLTAAQRLNSDTGEKALDDSGLKRSLFGLLLQRRFYVCVGGLSATLSLLFIWSHTADVPAEPPAIMLTSKQRGPVLDESAQDALNCKNLKWRLLIFGIFFFSVTLPNSVLSQCHAKSSTLRCCIVVSVKSKNNCLCLKKTMEAHSGAICWLTSVLLTDCWTVHTDYVLSWWLSERKQREMRLESFALHFLLGERRNGQNTKWLRRHKLSALMYSL